MNGFIISFDTILSPFQVKRGSDEEYQLDDDDDSSSVEADVDYDDEWSEPTSNAGKGILFCSFFFTYRLG